MKYSSIILIVLLLSCQEITPLEDINSQTNVKIKHSSPKTHEQYYWCDGEKFPLYEDNNKYYVIVPTDDLEKFDKSLRSLDIKANLKNKRIINDYRHLAINSSNKTKNSFSLTSFTLEDISPEILNLEETIYVAPYYKTIDGSSIGITNILSIQLPQRDYAHLEKIADNFNLTIIGTNQYDPSIYYLACTKESRGNALEIANQIYEAELSCFATPEFIIDTYLDSSPNDTYFNYQWNLNNTTNSTFDINYLNAISNFTFPHIDDIIVAVIDNGIDSNHEDLPLHNVSYNAHTGEQPSGIYGDHGTTVAGIIGAISNNGKGIAGIASGVKIMPISFCDYNSAITLGISQTTVSQLANAIRFAANNNANIINNSWSVNSSTPIAEINNAITYAHNKGCIVVFSAGNNNTLISQPAAGAPVATLVVGAITETGQRSSYSNYGNALDFVAPGDNIYTTSCYGGYERATGTSYSAPHVSGIAALVWARDPDLYAWRVRDILEQSVTKIGIYSYGSVNTRLNGSWNQYMGYGLIDANAAVSAVFAQAPPYPTVYTELSEISQSDLFSMGLESDIWEIAYKARGSGEIMGLIDNYDSSASYVWTSTLYPYTGFNPTFTVEYSCDTAQPELHEITCTIYKDGYRKTSGMSIAVVP